MIRELLNTLTQIPEIQELVSRVRSGSCPAAVNGLQPIQRACAGAAVAKAAERSSVYICSDEREARVLAQDLTALTGEKVVLLFSREWQLRTDMSLSRDWEQSRLAALYTLATDTPEITVATVDALLARTMPPEILQSLSFTLRVGERVRPEDILQKLIHAGYTRCDLVEGVGQFALRGGILDIFSPLMEYPVRCEFFDSEIDTLHSFNPGSQRRMERTESALILPALEALPHCTRGGIAGLAEKLETLIERLTRRQKARQNILQLQEDAEKLRGGSIPNGMDRYLAAIYPEFYSGISYLPGNALIFLCECGRIDERIRSVLNQNRQDIEIAIESGMLSGDYARLLLTAEEFYDALQTHPVIMADALPTSRLPIRPQTLLSLNARQLSAYGGSLEAAVTDLEHYRSNYSAVLALCNSITRAQNLQRLLEDRGLPVTMDLQNTAMPARGEIRISIGALSAGCEWPQLHLAVLTEGQLTGRKSRSSERKKTEQKSNRQKLLSYTDLVPGDLVIHTHHGLGRYTGIERMRVDGVEKDYIKIVYAGGDNLYVPATQLDLVSKYIGSGEEQQEHAKLNKLGGTDWTKQKTKARRAVQDLAKGLTKLYAERQRLPGFAFSPDSLWQREFEDAFPYEETEDQLRAIAEVKKDMESPRPMDRLLCGDVGYGKTEVAMRAIMKCIMDGKQAAILVPTTVLAQQHYTTARSRFKDFPVQVEVLSRFTSAKEQKRILKELASGKVNLLIGTHKLLGKKIAFHSLGLLVIDEEQRFGVSHKERLKEISKQVDVLTLSATPIPRTLNMAMSGLRDMSTIEEPPAGRLPVQTYVMEHDWLLLIDAMRRELSRGGQIYYIHNRIESIEQTAAYIQKTMGEDVRVMCGHGKMGEQALAAVMQAMVDGEADILVCTTIIETGIDIPNVNTLIIEDADHMGLAQLHQIRGRIGRSTRRAYAYLTYRTGKILQENAAKRLSAVREYVEFGSGFKIAMRDLEIRGAGNLLGPEQSGYMMSVGYDMYLKLLEEAVLEEQGGGLPADRECSADLSINANIPPSYVSADEERMDLYRRISAIRTESDAWDLQDELNDRYGKPPACVIALLDIALLRANAAQAGVSDIIQRKDMLKLVLREFHPEMIAAVSSRPRYRFRLSLAGGKQQALTLKLFPDADVLDTARQLIQDLLPS